MKSQLAVEISEYSVNFAILEDGTLLSIDKFIFNDKIDYRYKEQLDQFFLDKKYKEKLFDDCTVSWHTNFSTLIPNNLFVEVKAEDIFRLSFSEKISINDIDYNRVPTVEVVNVYSIPLWVKSFFVTKYPRVVIRHEGSYLLQGIFSSFSNKVKINIVLHADSFLLVVANESGLQFYSYFEFQSTDDIVYHLMYTLHQNNLYFNEGNITLCSSVGSSDEIAIDLMMKLKSFSELNQFKTDIN